MSEDRERCETCAHVRDKEDDGERMLACHRYPPVPGRNLYWPQFPFVRPTTVCGEYRSQPISKPKGKDDHGKPDTEREEA